MIFTAWKQSNQLAYKPISFRSFGREQHPAGRSRPHALAWVHGQIAHQDSGELLARNPSVIAHPGRTGTRKTPRRTAASSTF